eukprot:2881849-Prymnesium_polylepis.1
MYALRAASADQILGAREHSASLLRGGFALEERLADASVHVGAILRVLPAAERSPSSWTLRGYYCLHCRRCGWSW